LNSGIPKSGAIERLVIGFFLLLGGALWLLRQAGLIQETVWIWPLVLITFGVLIVVGAIYRLTHLTATAFHWQVL